MESLVDLLTQTPAGFAFLRGPEHVYEFVNPVYVQLSGRRDAAELLGKPIREAMPEVGEQGDVDGHGYFALLDRIYATGEPVVLSEAPVTLRRGEEGGLEEAVFTTTLQPYRNAAGETEGILAYAAEVTEQVRARERADAPRERLELAQQAGEIGTFEWNIQTNQVEWTPALEALYGLPPGGFGGTYSHWAAALHPDDREHAEREVRRVAAEGVELDTEFRIIRPDGDVRWIAAQGRLHPDRAGTPLRLVGVNMDITARKHTDTILRQRTRQAELGAEVGAALAGIETPREQLQRCAEAMVAHLDAAFARIWTLNTSGEVLELQASAGLYTHLNGPHSRVPVGAHKIGQIAAERWPHLTNDVRNDPRVSDPACAEREGMVAFAGYPLLVAGRLVGVMALFARQPLAETTLAALASVADTVASGIERARADADRRNFSALIENSGDCIGMATLTGQALYLNAAGCQLIGITPRQLVGSSIAALYTQETWSLLRKVALPVVLAGEQWIGEGQLRHAQTGEPIDIEMTIFTVREPVSGESLYLAAVQRDIRERRRLERLQQDFIAVASHDLKNPLGLIKGQAQILRRHLARTEKAEIDRDRVIAGLRTIDATTERMTALLDELLDVAALQTGQSLELRRLPVDLVALVRQCAGEYQRTAERHVIRVETDLSTLVGSWDVRRLERVVANLLTNAIKFSPAGGDIALHVAREESSDQPWAVLTVVDRGIGIPAADLSRVFARYQRGTNVVGIAGTGIGLAGARQIVERHGGALTVTSEPGQGSTFTVRLPLAE
ncbi:MAG: PAS domain-containing protein [Chloroflexota bacterium]|nr:PAS domain-containing protein [Chloroflexota bacterium]